MQMVLTTNITIWYPLTTANAAKGDAVIKVAQYANNAPVIPYSTITSH